MIFSPLGILREASGTRAETCLVATSVETGRKRPSAPDIATRAQSPFDRCARMGLPVRVSGAGLRECEDGQAAAIPEDRAAAFDIGSLGHAMPESGLQP